MNLRLLRAIVVACAVFAFGPHTAVRAGLFNLTNVVIPSGTTPNGSSWGGLSSGTVPVAYFNVSTGELQIDPKGRALSGFSFRYGASTVSSTTAGPFVFTSGGGAAAVGTTFPAGGYPFAPTTDMAQLGAGFYTLTTGTTASLASSGSGYFDVPWSFGVVAPSVNAPSLVSSAAAGAGFRAVTTGLSAGFAADYLGFGSGVGMFDYTVDGTPGRGVGAVIPVQVVPEPSALATVAGGAAALTAVYRRFRRTRNRTAATA